MEKQAALDLLEFIHESPTNFHAVLSIKQRLQAHGFKQLFSGEAWHIEHGGKYFVTKNHSSLYAFIPCLPCVLHDNPSLHGSVASGVHHLHAHPDIRFL